MPEIAYWSLLLIIMLLALPLIFFLGILAVGFMLFLIILAGILTFFNHESFELSVFIIDFFLVLFFFVAVYLLSLFLFAALGKLILSLTNNRALLRFLNHKNFTPKKKLFKYYSRIFFLSVYLYVKKFKWVFWIILPIFIITLFFTNQEFNHNEFWI